MRAGAGFRTGNGRDEWKKRAIDVTGADRESTAERRVGGGAEVTARRIPSSQVQG